MLYCVIFDTVQQYCGFVRLCGSRFLPIWKILMRHCSILLSFCAVFRFSDPPSPLRSPLNGAGPIGHFQKYHNTLCWYSKILHKHCFYFLLRLLCVPCENKNNAYAKFWRTNKEYFGIFESCLWHKMSNREFKKLRRLPQRKRHVKI